MPSSCSPPWWLSVGEVYTGGGVPGIYAKYGAIYVLLEVSLYVSFLNSKKRRDFSPSLRAVQGHCTVPIVTWDITEMPAAWSLLFSQSSRYCISSRHCSLWCVAGSSFSSGPSTAVCTRTSCQAVTPRLLDPSPRVLEVLSLGWGLGVCISYPFTGDPASAGLGTPLWEPLPYRISQEGKQHKFIKPTEQLNLPSDISPWSKAIVFYLEWRIEGYA